MFSLSSRTGSKKRSISIQNCRNSPTVNVPPTMAAALGRSAALTSGYRSQIFWAWFLLGLVVGVVVTVVFMALQGAFAFGTSDQEAERLGVIVAGVLAAVGGSLEAVASTVVYHGLRDAKEGMSADDLVKAFE